MFKDVIYLLDIDESENENGFPQISISKSELIFANRKSIRSSEFYLASSNGYQLELMFEIYSLNYSDQKYLEYNSKQYEIVRTYDRGEFIELICQAYTGKSLSPLEGDGF